MTERNLVPMRAAARGPNRSRGMAVISALLVVAAAAVIAASMLQRQTTQIRTLESESARVQARALLLGGIDWARIILRADARRHATVRGDQIWATPISYMRVSQDGDEQEAIFSGRVEDELSKFNLQNLARNGEPDPVGIATLKRLMQALSLDVQAVDLVAQRVAMAQSRTAQSAPGASSSGEGVGNEPVAITGKPDASKNTPETSARGSAAPPQAPGLRGISSLRAFGLDDSTIASLRPYLTVLPVRTPLNVNTVSAEVLSAALPDVSLAQAIALVDQRDRGQYFNNPADFRNRLNTPDVEFADADLAVASPWFSVTGTVRIGQANVDMQALLRRDGEAIPTVIWMMETL